MVFFNLLPRVSAALAQFIKPITTALPQTSVRDRTPREQQSPKKEKPPQKDHPENGSPDPQGFQRFQPAQPPAENVIPFPKMENNPATPASPKEALQGDTHSFLQIFSLLQSQKNTLLRLFGIRSYQKPLQGQKKAAKYRKGAMLDKKAG